MVALLALASIAGGLLTALATYPMVGLWSVLMAPLGGSMATLALGVGIARASRGVPDAAIDGMVTDLRSVLPKARPTRPLSADAASSPEGRRAAN